ncbi:hypothetical protein [Hyphomicrobium facile]|uniref:Uncharacterized protein n=1 Tax=Hyphomicrobium facile TaxID=51670 RepID=A0A1I7MWL4_9HYPH|nr:hypothetical protein [Hyphomicrobium facile]SFV26790.1 hypothetical protein SAMN04488557_0593 [Hyphomicrobium facile]
MRLFEKRRYGRMLRIFLSFERRLTQEQWGWATAAATAIYICGCYLCLSLAIRQGEIASRVNFSLWLVVWSTAFSYVITALCAQRLADSGQPVWLCATVAVPGFLLVLGFAFDFVAEMPVLGPILIAYLGVRPLPVLVACATSKSA